MVRQLRVVQALCFLIAAAVYQPLPARADIVDPFDSTAPTTRADEAGDEDADKTAYELVMEANALLVEERPLDARTKLLKALAKDPKEHRALTMLAGYYMVHVSHFRLALRYIRQAQAVFTEKNGPPPYDDLELKSEHAHILYLLSQVRLNLDNYQGALDILDEYADWGYYAEWYAGSRAWVLMKLGQLDEATRVARLGVLSGAEGGRTLNMLGILLSMQREREASIQIFKEAIAYEFSLGTMGQPATPLNNTGEVFKEIFSDDRAESSWLKATNLPDGCEHVLPSLNLALLYIEQASFSKARRTIDQFESCVAQFPLRNGEEHRALVHMARGRIALHTGHVEEAIRHFEGALERRQWFGKIGTSQEDLLAGVLTSLGQALLIRNNHLALRAQPDLRESAASLSERSWNRIRSWWTLRRARQILAEDLKNIEDIYVRNTDSMLEYPTLGSVLAGYPARLLAQRLAVEDDDDGRAEATTWYLAWRGESQLARGDEREGRASLKAALERARPEYDRLLMTHLQLTELRFLEPDDPRYAEIAETVFSSSRAHLRNYGFRLPVTVTGGDAEVRSIIGAAAFHPVTPAEARFQVTFAEDADHPAERYVLTFSDRLNAVGDIRIRAGDLTEAVNKLSDEVCTEDSGETPR